MSQSPFVCFACLLAGWLACLLNTLFRRTFSSFSSFSNGISYFTLPVILLFAFFAPPLFPPPNLKGHLQHLKEVWVKTDGMDADTFAPKTFFRMHGFFPLASVTCTFFAVF